MLSVGHGYGGKFYGGPHLNEMPIVCLTEASLRLSVPSPRSSTASLGAFQQRTSISPAAGSKRRVVLTNFKRRAGKVALVRPVVLVSRTPVKLTTVTERDGERVPENCWKRIQGPETTSSSSSPWAADSSHSFPTSNKEVKSPQIKAER